MFQSDYCNMVLDVKLDALMRCFFVDLLLIMLMVMAVKSIYRYVIEKAFDKVKHYSMSEKKLSLV